MKSDGVKDVLKWLEQKCKEQKRLVDKAEEYAESNRHWGLFDDTRCIVDAAYVDLRLAKERLQAYVDIKIGVEKYMRKLKHQGK